MRDVTNQRSLALAEGRDRYRTGIPCPKGHRSERYAKQGQCIECLKEDGAKRVRKYQKPMTEEGRAAARAATKRYREKHPDRVLASRKRNFDKEKGRMRAYRANLGTWAKAAIQGIRWRAKLNRLECTISAADIQAPSHCPVLGIQLFAGSGRHIDSSPSVDRMDPKKGYVLGNVRVISYRANRLKSDATVEELRQVISYMEQLQ